MAVDKLLACGIVILTLGFAGVSTTSRASPPTDKNTSPVLPVRSACVSSPFGQRFLPDHPIAGIFHKGIDLPAPVGAPVISVGPGVILRVQKRGVGGLEMLVQHNGFIGVYSHLGSVAPAIAEGRRNVVGGERLAVVGGTGLSFGPHLYFGMIVNGQPVDPAPFLGVKPCVGGEGPIIDSRLRPTRLFAQHQPR